MAKFRTTVGGLVAGAVLMSACSPALAGGPLALGEPMARPSTVGSPKPDERVFAFGQGLASAAQSAGRGQTTQALLTLGESAIDYWLPSLGGDVPEWLQHIEVEVGATENNTPEYSILGVFPLYETEDLKNTVFLQASQLRYRYLGVDRDVTNIGIGYRRLFFNNTVLAGVNGFFDYGWEYHHQRTSVGAELKWAGLDFGTNYYMRTSARHSAGDDGTFEEVLSGHDIRLAAQVPFLPWARVHGRRYWWQTSFSSEDIKGWELGMEMDLHQNIQLEAGIVDDNTIDDDNNNEGYIKIRFALDLGDRPVAFSSAFISDRPWLMRDMTEYRLDKVRRENKIITERVSSGVVVTRGS